MVLHHFNIEEFLKTYWQKKPLLIKQALPQFQSPISQDELAGLSLEADCESRIVIQNPMQPFDYQLERGPFKSRRYSNLPASHWTLLVQGVDRFVPEVAKLVSYFSFIPAWRFDDVMISYAALGGGVGPHYDFYDVFLLQAQGRRQWSLTSKNCHVQNAVPNVPLRLMQTFETEMRFEVEPGDILYIPPKWGHDGVALTQDCMTYSFGYRNLSLAEILHQLADVVEAHPEYYQDPSWVGVQPGIIPQSALNNAQKLLKNIFEDELNLAQAFGQIVTQLDTQAQILLEEQKPRPIKIEAFKSKLLKASSIAREHLVRVVKLNNMLYVNGEALAFGGVDESLIDELIKTSEWNINLIKQAVSNRTALNFLYTLWLKGFFVLV
jgi:50S ribosomal protein L16 3-hydroxylase